jgi:hypothetical protein
MGRRDYRHREPKKSKRDARKISPVTIVPPPMTVEVIKKSKKKREEAEGEE